MNLILQASPEMPYHTNLSTVFEAWDGLQRDLNWLVTDLDCNYQPPALQNPEEPKWFSGDELSDLVSSNPGLQFFWGVFSGFSAEKDVAWRDGPMPYADGNSSYWGKSPRIQHPDAVIELVCWDSTYTILLSEIIEASERFEAFFSDAIDLKDFVSLSSDAAT